MPSDPSEIPKYFPSPPRTKTLALITAIPFVFLIHAALQFILYRGEVVSHWPIASSELLVFGFPLLFAISAYSWIAFKLVIFRKWSTPQKITFITSFTLIVSFVSVCGSLMLPFNMYGT